jgi:hypothetical protein
MAKQLFSLTEQALNEAVSAGLFEEVDGKE